MITGVAVVIVVVAPTKASPIREDDMVETSSVTRWNKNICAMVKSRVFLGMVIPPLIGNPYNGYINPYYCVDDHPLLYGNNGSLDPGTYKKPYTSGIPQPWKL